MGLLDNLFNHKKDAFGEAGDKLVDKAVNTAKDMIGKPVQERIEQHFNDVSDMMTESLEAIKNGEEPPEEPLNKGKKTGMPDFDTLTKKWSTMIDEIEEQELNKYKICPACGEAVSSDNQFCPECGAKLPEHTAAKRICPYCGAENQLLAFNCVKCGKKIPLIPEAENQKD